MTLSRESETSITKVRSDSSVLQLGETQARAFKREYTTLELDRASFQSPLLSRAPTGCRFTVS
jgi:hypothetical protein